MSLSHDEIISEIWPVLQQQLHLAASMPMQFIAQGECTINYRILLGGRQLVIRLVTASQMGLSVQDQVKYEASALDILSPTRRTPLLYGYELNLEAAPYPFLIIEYLPGCPLNYRTDLAGAAECLAEIHQLEVPDNCDLKRLPDPLRSTVDEAVNLAVSYLEWPEVDQSSAAALLRLIERVRYQATREPGLFADSSCSIINTDLNTHNFVVDDGYVQLIDWEKARIGPAVQDLAHFLIPTTTLWRQSTAARLSAIDVRKFLDAYLALRPELDQDRFLAQLKSARSLATLRAVAWCAWAVWASATGHRPITNDETLRRSRSYLEPEFLDSLR